MCLLLTLNLDYALRKVTNIGFSLATAMNATTVVIV